MYVNGALAVHFPACSDESEMNRHEYSIGHLFTGPLRCGV